MKSGQKERGRERENLVCVYIYYLEPKYEYVTITRNMTQISFPRSALLADKKDSNKIGWSVTVTRFVITPSVFHQKVIHPIIFLNICRRS